MRIRPMVPADAGQVAELVTQLGYPSSPSQLARRFAVVAERPDHAVFVAVAPDGAVLGVIHARVADLLELDPSVAIESLVVDEGARGRGIGGSLVAEAEQWASARGIGAVWVRSNVTRVAAHRFYERRGYTRATTSFAFTKPLPSPEC